MTLDHPSAVLDDHSVSTANDSREADDWEEVVESWLELNPAGGLVVGVSDV